MRPHSRHWRTKKQAGLKKSRPQAGRENLKKLPLNSPPVTLEITHIGGRGDGVGQAEYTLDYASKSYAVFVPETLPGEVVIAQPVAVNAQGIRARAFSRLRLLCRTLCSTIVKKDCSIVIGFPAPGLPRLGQCILTRGVKAVRILLTTIEA